jgi:hypothetical protein
MELVTINNTVVKAKSLNAISIPISLTCEYEGNENHCYTIPDLFIVRNEAQQAGSDALNMNIKSTEKNSTVVEDIKMYIAIKYNHFISSDSFQF